jgi:histidinol-phosphate aminotransferase
MSTASLPNPSGLIRPLVKRLHAYVPGEQPKIPGLIKLNTNENPYPPSPKVLAAVKGAVDGRLRLYPNPSCDALREKLAEWHGCAAENIVVGNGSDELLEMVTRAFVEPVAIAGKKKSAATVQYFDPSYSLYPVLIQTHGAALNPVALNKDFSLPVLGELAGRGWDFKAALSYVTTPNAPSGRAYANAELEALCRKQRGVVVLDETYVDFAEQNAMDLALKYPHVLVGRTFSKAYSLCYLRVGYFVGHPEIIEALQKVRDSYNVNGLGQVAALATLENLEYYRKNFQRIIASRTWLGEKLAGMRFEVLPSQTNFLFVRPPVFLAKTWLEKLRERKILVRWFSAPEVCDYLRISIGTESEVEALVRAVKRILK